ncbi:MAG: hypothetical protein ABIF71_03460 [Planctomycetota bacterium]
MNAGMAAMIVALALGLAAAGCGSTAPAAVKPAAPPPPVDPFPAVAFGHMTDREFPALSGLTPAADAAGTDRVRAPIVRSLTITYSAAQFADFGHAVPCLKGVDPARVGQVEIILCDITRVALPSEPPAGTAAYWSELQAGEVCVRLTDPEGARFDEEAYKAAGFIADWTYDPARGLVVIGRDRVFAHRTGPQ